MRTPPHPLEEALRARVRLLATTLRPSTVRQYEHTLRRFMAYLRRSFPDIRRANQLRRDPHVLGWLAAWEAYKKGGKTVSKCYTNIKYD